jgi:hypothetical protein
VVSPAPRDVWNEVLAADRYALVSQTPAWVDSLCANNTYSDASRLYLWPNGRQLVLPMVRAKRWPAGASSEASYPDGWGIGGLIGAGEITPLEVGSVLADLTGRPLLRTILRPDPLRCAAWAAAERPDVRAIRRVSYILDLAGGFDTVWAKRFRATTRSKVRKAERSNLVVERDTTGRLLPVFYELYWQSIRTWARQHHEPLALARWRAERRDPQRKFERIAQAVGDAMRIWIAWRDRQLVAGVLVLTGRNAFYTRGATNRELARATRANELLQQLAIQDACREGCHYYHLGDTRGSASLAQFKEQFGAQAYQYAEYRIERLPVTRLEAGLRGVVKRLVGFKEA